jgi:hypothetical protein
MNKIQIKGDEKIQRKRRTRAVALPQLAASGILVYLAPLVLAVTLPAEDHE